MSKKVKVNGSHFIIGTANAVYRCTEFKSGQWKITVQYTNSKNTAMFEIKENWAETRVYQFIFEFDKIYL